MSNIAIKYGSFTDANGKEYKTVEIGSQVWMAENLDCGCHDPDDSYEIGECYYEHKQEHAKYGRFYTWEQAKENAPEGWHLPSVGEWDVLLKFVGYSADKLKSEEDWHGNGNGIDSYGFSALPGGYAMTCDEFKDIGLAGRWWSATGESEEYAKSVEMSCNNSDAKTIAVLKTLPCSVRYVKDS